MCRRALHGWQEGTTFLQNDWEILDYVAKYDWKMAISLVFGAWVAAWEE